MKVIHFVHSFLPTWGGTTVRVLNLLKDKSIKYCLYLAFDFNPDPKLKRYDKIDNVTVRRIKIGIPGPKEEKDLEFYQYLYRLYQYLAQLIDKRAQKLADSVIEKDYDVIHGHNPIYFGLAGAKLAQKTEKPFVYEIHSYVDVNELISDEGKKRIAAYIIEWSKAYWTFLKEKKIARQADIVLVQTPDLADKICQVYRINKDKIRIVPNGVDPYLFDPKKWKTKAQTFRKKMGWDKKIVFMYSGFLSENNGVDVLTQRIAALPDRLKKKVKLVLFGRGVLEGYLRDMAKKNKGLIDFLDPVPYPQMPLYYAASDVYAIPRPSETATETVVPLKLIEAAAMEKLILASDVGGLKKLAKQDTAILFKKDNVKDLDRKIKYIIENFKKLPHLGKNARKLSVQEFDWDKSRQDLKKIYQELTNRKQ